MYIEIYTYTLYIVCTGRIGDGGVERKRQREREIDSKRKRATSIDGEIAMREGGREQ